MAIYNEAESKHRKKDVTKFSDIEKYQEVQCWLKTVSEKTKPTYLTSLKKFCEFSQMTPKELILERDKEIRSSDPNSRTKIRDLVLEFRKYLEKEGYAPRTINTMDGAVRSFFTSILGKAGMVNVKNYPHRQVSLKKDFVPTLDELKRMLDVCNLEEKFRIIFLAQTGMRISDALDLKIGDIQRELELNKCPLAVYYLPEKDREAIGERITFLASDGVNILKQYLEWRKKSGEELTPESPLFVGRTKEFGGRFAKLTRQALNDTLKNAAERAGFNGNGKYGRFRAHCLRKFFVTQLTNHGVEDKIVNFFIGHKIPDVDRVYWYRRVEELREIYKQREQYLNPLSQKRNYNLNDIKDLKAKIEELERRLEEVMSTRTQIKEVRYDVKIVTSEEEVIELAKIGYDCQVIGENKWLMRRSLM